MNQSLRNNVSHIDHNETPIQKVADIVEKALQNLSPEVAELVRGILEKLRKVEKELNGPLTNAYLEQLKVHSQIQDLIPFEAAAHAANDEPYSLVA